MAWTKYTLPASGTPWVVGYGAGRWLVYDDWNYDRFHVTSNWSTLTTTMSASFGLSSDITGVCFDGTSWRFVARTTDGFWTSTDGSTGATWAKTTPDYSGGASSDPQRFSAKHIHSAASGRLIVLSAVGLSYSDNGGSTWVLASSAISAGLGANNSGISQFGSSIFAWSASTSSFLHSTDNGATWSSVTTPTLAGEISSVSAISSGWLITTLNASDVPRISTNSGASWSNLSGFTSDKYQAASDGVTMVLYEEDNPVAIVRHSTDLSAWTTVDATGLTSDYNPCMSPVVVGGSTILIASGYGSSSVGIYTTSLPVAAINSWLAIDSPLGSVALLGFSDFAVALTTTEWVDYYACDLVVGSTVIARMPMSSWQATLQTGRASYVQAVIPSAENYATTIQSNPTAEFVIYKGARSTTGEAIEQEMARAPVEALQLAKGFSKHTAVLSGYTNAFLSSTSTTARTLQNVRQIFSGTAGYRVRSAIDWYLRPGMTANFDGGSFTVAYINYYVGNGDAYMDVGERSL